MNFSFLKGINGLIAVTISALLAILPELLPENWKTELKNLLGSNYNFIWTTVFIMLTIASLLLTRNQNSSRNTLKIKGSKNKTVQSSNKSEFNKLDIEGNENETHQS